MRYRLSLQIISANNSSFLGVNLGAPVYSDTVEGLLKQLPDLLKKNQVQLLEVFDLVASREHTQYFTTEALLRDGTKVNLDIIAEDRTPPVKFRELVSNAFMSVREQVLDANDTFKVLETHEKEN